MKIVEHVEVINGDKTFLGKKHMELTVDTDTGEVSIDAPAMFTNPIVNLDDLKRVVDRLDDFKANQ